MSETPLQHDARHRLAGYLLAQGFVDRHQREAVLTALQQSMDEQSDATADSPQWVSQAVALCQAWHDQVIDHLAEPDRRAAARQWLGRHLREHLARHADAFAQPEAFAAHLRAAFEADSAAGPPLPKAHPQDMPRQPLGQLPAVMRGSFWASTARWAVPLKSRPHAEE